MITSGPTVARMRSSRTASASSTPSTVIAPWMSYQRPSGRGSAASRSISSSLSSCQAAAVTVPPGSDLPTRAPCQSAASRSSSPGARKG